MANPSNSTVDIMAVVQRRMERLSSWCDANAHDAEEIAKAKAAWTDRTGDARRLIKGISLDNNMQVFDLYDHEGKKLVKTSSDSIDGEGALGIALVHRVEYGKYLERDGDGKNAVLKPTIEGMRTEFLAGAKRIWGEGHQ